MFMSEDDREEIKLRDRKGFVRIAGERLQQQQKH
jgi:hypothetical protein